MSEMHKNSLKTFNNPSSSFAYSNVLKEEWHLTDEWSVHDETYETISGDESDVEDNLDLHPVRDRQANPDLPETCTLLETVHGSKVYVVGTAHFSAESLNDVTKVGL